MKRLYVVDGQTAVRQMLVEILNDSSYEVVGDSSNGIVATNEILKMDIHLVILDVKLSGMSGSELVLRVKRKNPNVRFIVFSDEKSPSVVRDMLKAGAHGFVERTSQLSELRQAIEVVASGGSFYGPNIAAIIRSVVTNPLKVKGPEENLTHRERQVLRLIAMGSSTKEIASDLGLSSKTVENHRCSMMRKLDFHNVAAITRYAVENRLVEVNFAV